MLAGLCVAIIHSVYTIWPVETKCIENHEQSFLMYIPYTYQCSREEGGFDEPETKSNDHGAIIAEGRSEKT